MKSKNPFLMGVVVTVLAVSLIWAGVAYASTSCFNDTNGHWAETYICWMLDNGITSEIGLGVYGPESNVTCAQMTVFLNKLADIPLHRIDNCFRGLW